MPNFAGSPVGRMLCDVAVLVTPDPANKQSFACDGKRDGRPETKKEKTESKTDRQRRRQEMSEITTSNLSMLAPCHPLSSLEHPLVSQARGRFLGWSARRTVHGSYKFPAGPAAWLLGQAVLQNRHPQSSPERAAWAGLRGCAEKQQEPNPVSFY